MPLAFVSTFRELLEKITGPWPPVITTMDVVLALIFLAIGYLSGSFPSGWIVGRVFYGVDPRQHGSGRIGFTNTLRTLGVGPALIVVTGDIAKAMLPVLAARWLFPGNHGLEAVAAFAVILGHNWPLYIGFRGGRGVVVGATALALMVPPVIFLLFLFFIPIVLITRYISLGSLASAVLAPLFVGLAVLFFHVPVAYFLYALCGSFVIIFQHRDNIYRLLTGTERRIELKWRGV